MFRSNNIFFLFKIKILTSFCVPLGSGPELMKLITSVVPSKWVFFVKNLYILLQTIARSCGLWSVCYCYSYYTELWMYGMNTKLLANMKHAHFSFCFFLWHRVSRIDFNWVMAYLNFDTISIKQIVFNFLLKIMFVYKTQSFDTVHCQSVYGTLSVVFCLMGVSVVLFWYVIHCLGWT